MQSQNFKPGVSGWKIHKNGGLEFNSSSDPCLSSLDKEVSSKPFVVVDGVTYIRQAEIDKASIQVAKLAPEWSVNVALLHGNYVAAGIGLGITSQFLVDADKYRINCMCGGGPAGFKQT